MSGSMFRTFTHSLATLSSVARDLIHLFVLVSRSRRALAAENLFRRKQLALFEERKVKPHRAHDSTRLIMVILGRMFSWRDALVNVTRYIHPLAPQRIPSPLALEIPAGRQTANPQGSAQTPQKLLVMLRRSRQISSQALQPFALGT
jgi:hypothetical protein